MKRHAGLAWVAVIVLGISGCGGAGGHHPDVSTTNSVSAPPVNNALSFEESCNRLTQGGTESPIIRVVDMGVNVKKGNLSKKDEESAYTVFFTLEAMSGRVPKSLEDVVNRLNKGPATIYSAVSDNKNSVVANVKPWFEASLEAAETCTSGEQLKDLAGMISSRVRSISGIENGMGGGGSATDGNDSGSSKSFTTGTFKVGKDIAAGNYVTEAITKFDSCYWERKDSAGNIIDNNYVGSAFRAEVIILDTDYSFTSQNCGEWHLIE